VSSDSSLLDPAPALEHADRMLRGIGAGTAGLWPRTAARLTRLAVERATDLYWSRTRPEMAACPTTMRILMLETALGRSAARQAFLLLSRLSDATHVHPYELAPTVGELRNWHQEATHLVTQLAGAAAPTTHSPTVRSPS
jgi:hypothetical protein